MTAEVLERTPLFTPETAVYLGSLATVPPSEHSVDLIDYNPQAAAERAVSGHLSRDGAELANHFHQLDSELATALVEQAALREPVLRVAVRAQLKDFPAIIEDGRLKSVHETHTSTGNGAGSDNYSAFRTRMETEQLGHQPGEPSIIYGFLEDSDNLSSKNTVSAYGQVELVLKQEVGHRATFSPGDSLTWSRGAFYDFSDAVLVKQIADTQSQKGIDITNTVGSYRTGGIEAQIFGGVSLDDVETISLDVGGVAGGFTPKTLELLEQIHREKPDIQLRINLDTSQTLTLPVKEIQEHPYIHFELVMSATSPFQVNQVASGSEPGDVHVRETFRERYDLAAERKQTVEQKARQWWVENKPDDDFPPNLGFSLIF